MWREVLDALVEGVEGGQLESLAGAIDEGGGFVAKFGVASTGPSDALNGGGGTLVMVAIEINLI